MPPTLLLLHGFLGDGDDWTPLLPALHAAGYRCLTPDLPLLPDLPARADALAAYLTAHGVPRAHAVIGYSLGGRVALHLALRHPHRLRHLALESASPGLADPHARAERAARDAALADDLRADLPAFLHRWYSLPLFHSLQRRPDLLHDLLHRRAAGDPDALANTLRDLSPGLQPSLWHLLDRITCPTLLISGALDPAYPALCDAAAHAIGPHATHLSLTHAGHNTHLEAPDAFAQALLPFLALDSSDGEA